MPKKGKKSVTSRGLRKAEDMATHDTSHSSEHGSDASPTRSETTPVPQKGQNMDLCSLLKWMTDRDDAASVEREEEAAR